MLPAYMAATFLFMQLQVVIYSNIYLTYSLFFSLLNLVYAFFVFKWNVFMNIFCSIALGFLALHLADIIAHGDWFWWDPYGIKSTIFKNAIFEIIGWEIVYRFKQFIVTKNQA